MRFLLFFIFAFPAFSAEIDSVRVGTNTMLITGAGLDKLAKAQLGKKAVAVMPISDSQAVIYCKNLAKSACENQRWLPGNYTLKLYRKARSNPYLKHPVVVTGQELSNQPPIPEVIPPSPVG